MKIGRTKISGLDKMQDSDLILGFLKAVKRDTNLKLPALIEFKKLKFNRYGCAWTTRIIINNALDFKNIIYTLLHELVHVNLPKQGHTKKFWFKLFKVCTQLNLEPIIETDDSYKRAAQYLKKYKLKRGD